MDLSKEDFTKLFEIFKVECDEHIQKLNSALVSLEASPDQTDLIEEIFREAHSLKGAARMMNFSAIEAISHHLETILGKVKNNELALSRDVNDLILKGLDAVEAIVHTISDVGEEGEVDSSAILHELEIVSKGIPGIREDINPEEEGLSEDENPSYGDLNKQDYDKLFEIFSAESDEHIQKLSSALISLEATPDQSELIEEIFREAHSLKGAARMMDFRSIEGLSHHLETILGNVKNEGTPLTSDINSLILRALDAVEAIVQTISGGGREDEVDTQALMNELECASKKGSPQAPKASTSELQGNETDFLNLERDGAVKMDLDLFSQETRDAHRKLVNSLLEIEKAPNSLPEIKTAYEQAYALKGSARIVKHEAMGDIAFSMERLLQAILDKTLPISSPIVSILLEGSDFIRKFITEVEAEEVASVPQNFDKVISAINFLVKPPIDTHANTPVHDASPVQKQAIAPKEATQKRNVKASPSPPVKQNWPSKTSTDKPKSTVRVSSEKLDRLMDQTGEFLIMKLKARQRLVDVQTLINDYNGATRDIRNKISHLKKTALHRADIGAPKANHQKLDLLDMSGISFISDRLEFLHKSLYDDFRQFSIIIDRLQDDVKKTRLFPFQTVLDTFPRMVRDLSASVHKKVRLETSGVNIELDKYILEEIKDPLMHIIRNGIDHGIESPEERVKLGKPEAGLITIEVSHKGNNGVIKVVDDGRGIDLERIKHSALKKSLYTEKELELMKEKQILNLIFHPGFSTSEIITDLSGRGVGMDVVKSNIEKLSGTIDIETEPSKGSTFTMVIPLTLSTTQSLKITVCGGTYFLPVNMVERIIKVVEKDLPVMEGFPAIHYSGSYIPYVKLGTILEMTGSETKRNDELDELERPVAVLRSGKTLAAFALDGFMGEEEILMKGLGPYMKRVRNISGVTIMRDGTIAPVLNVTDLINTVQLNGIVSSKKGGVKMESKMALSVLVVDDSVMTRTLEKNILESYGYRVSTAVDGRDALSKLQERDFDIIVSDVQMPNLNGLDFTQQVRQDKRYKDIPVILVTALESDEDKRRGIEVGADAYIVKSSFDQSNLLSTIKKLV